ncbi:MAG: ribosome maturation factor RimM [Cyclobacteriaceae bacterium]|nr:ribosome maturation factor RimM [Cyclobacteriaceae bacterium]MDH4298781.1 ribosome maturation factor RimM [Cyclobacteriaceae bacterium]MDH5247944.1 ribosome maturation factor RimM [Cyclobacteriaceae bacterium]
MEIDSCFKIGFILKTHGLKGEVTISIDGDAPAGLSALASVFLEVDGRLVPYFIQSLSIRGTKGFVKFEDIDSIDMAAKLVKKSIYLQKSARPKSTRGEFYDDEIINFSVIDEIIGPLGSVVEIMQAGPNRLLVLDNNGKEILIPINSPFIIRINKSKRTITVNLPGGFSDL